MAWPIRAAHQEFEEFVARAGESLMRTGFLMLENSTEAEDAVQETLLRVAKRWYRVRRMDHPVAYARRVLLSVIFDDAARRSRQRNELLAAASRSGRVERADDGAGRALSAVDVRLQIAPALAALSMRQRAVVVLRYWADLSEAEVAATLGCSVGTVKSTASRSLARLRELMSDSLGEPNHVREDPDSAEPAALAGRPHAAASTIRRRIP